jgi:uncharacterized membrane protein YfcA
MSAFTALWPQGLHGASYAQMATVVLIGACLQGIGGIGFAMFSAPIAGLFFPSMAPGPLLLLGLLVSLMSALREFRSIDWAVARYGIGGRFVGGALAAAALAVLAPRPLAIAFALMLLVAIGLSMAGWTLRPTRRNSALAGIASGVMGTITSAGAPPFAILTQGMQPPRLRATVGCILAVGSATSLGMLAAVGRFNHADLQLSFMLLPWILIGFLLSGKVGSRVSPMSIRRGLLSLMTLSALGILGRVALT